MDFPEFLIKIVTEQPTLAPFVLLLFFWWRENGERRELQKTVFELQGKLIQALNDTKTIMSQGNALLQFITNLRGRR